MIKYYFKGDPEKGQYLMKRLIQYGGKQHGDWIDGCDSKKIYYIKNMQETIALCDLSPYAIDILRKDGYVDISQNEEINNTDEYVINLEQREFDLAKELLINLIKANGVKTLLDINTGIKSINYDSINCDIELSIKIARDFINKFNTKTYGNN